MTEPVKPEVKTYDLTREIPSGITLSGLSEPKFDGVNYFRQPISDKSTLYFSTNGISFAQLEYLAYSPNQDVDVEVFLDGVLVRSKIFPVNKDVGRGYSGDFLQSGRHSILLQYKCVSKCLPTMRQYWTKITTVEVGQLKAVQDVGIGVERLELDAPGSLLKLTGAGPLQFDGANFWRPIDRGGFQLSWPGQVKPLNTSFLVNGNQDFEVLVKAGNKVLATGKGTAKQGTFIHTGLVGQPVETKVNVEVRCLKTPQIPCTALYFSQVSVISGVAPWMTSGAGVAVGVLILFGLLVWGLNLAPRRLPA